MQFPPCALLEEGGLQTPKSASETIENLTPGNCLGVPDLRLGMEKVNSEKRGSMEKGRRQGTFQSMTCVDKPIIVAVLTLLLSSV